MTGTKCPFVTRKGTMDGQPTGICRFDKVYGHMCPLLTDDTINDDDITCFNLPERLYARIDAFKR